LNVEGTWVLHLGQIRYCAGVGGETRINAAKLNFASSEGIRVSPCISMTPQTDLESDFVVDVVIVDKRFYFLEPILE
jgi:hypothetical protein